MCDGLEPLPIKADFQDEVTMFCTVCRVHRRHLFDAAICAHVGNEDIPIKLHRDATHGHFNLPGTFVFRLKPEVFCGDIAPGQLHGQLHGGQQDIPSS